MKKLSFMRTVKFIEFEKSIVIWWGRKKERYKLQNCVEHIICLRFAGEESVHSVSIATIRK